MRFFTHSLLAFATLSKLTSSVLAQDESDQTTFRYESDISRLRSIVVHSLYSEKDVFLRELLSNSNDALERVRLSSLRDKTVMEGLEKKGWAGGNITIEARKDEAAGGGQLIIRDTGIGMTKDELATNLGTIAKSGTSDFVKKATESNDGSNLIGQFGLGFYSVFLIADTATVSSLPPPSKDNPDPQQYTFTSSSSGDEFKVFKDPRGETLGPCGTEIVLDISEEGEKEGWLDVDKLKSLVEKHSQYATTFPIYILKQSDPRSATTDEDEEDTDVSEIEESKAEWLKLNTAPIWMKDPKEVTSEEYKTFYHTMTKDPVGETVGWSHWKGDSGDGVGFRAIMYIPSKLPENFWTASASSIGNIRLLVKRVFISDLGEGYLPRWLSFLKIVVDADDLPLNVSRETLQGNKFVRQLKRILINKALQMFTKLAKDDPEQFKEVSQTYGNIFRIGLVESEKKDQQKLAGLLRFESTRSNYTSLDDYAANRKDGQTQLFYLAGVGEPADSLARSPFVEKLKARGYEVLLLNQPADETMMTTLRTFQGMTAQDVSKKGLKMGDEDEDEDEMQEFEMQKKAFKPLLSWMKKILGSQVGDVVLTNRLVTSPCAVVADSFGLSSNMMKLMAANLKEDDKMYQMAMMAPKTLEINYKAPLMVGFLDAVMELPEDEDEIEDDFRPNVEALKDSARILFDTALVRSGFTVQDTNDYFDRVELLLRRTVGVSATAKGSIPVKPAPPQAVGPLPEAPENPYGAGGPGGPGFDGPEVMNVNGGEKQPDMEFLDWQKVKEEMQKKKDAGGGEFDREDIKGLLKGMGGHDEL